MIFSPIRIALYISLQSLAFYSMNSVPIVCQALSYTFSDRFTMHHEHQLSTKCGIFKCDIMPSWWCHWEGVINSDWGTGWQQGEGVCLGWDPYRPSIIVWRFLEDLMKGHWEEIRDFLTSLLSASQNIMEGKHHTEVYCSGLIYWPFSEWLWALLQTWDQLLKLTLPDRTAQSWLFPQADVLKYYLFFFSVSFFLPLMYWIWCLSPEEVDHRNTLLSSNRQ